MLSLVVIVSLVANEIRSAGMTSLGLWRAVDVDVCVDFVFVWGACLVK